MVKKWLKMLKKDVVGEVVRDYSDLVRDDDRIGVRLQQKGRAFRFLLTLSDRNAGNAIFNAQVSHALLDGLRELVADMQSVTTSKSKNKEYRLRFRDGAVDLLVTYNYDAATNVPRQRSAPLNSRTYKLFQEMLEDVEVLLQNTVETTDDWGD